MLSINKFFQSFFILSFIIIFCLTVSCSTDSKDEFNIIGTFNFEGFENQETYSIKQSADFIFIGTEVGLFAKKKNTNGWQNLVVENISIRSFEYLTKNKIIAALYFNDQDSATIGVSTDFGESWSPYRNGFDPVENSIPTIITQQEGTNILYAGGSILRIAQSEDQGQNWEIAFGAWDGLGSLFFIHAKEQVVWTGGGSASFTPLLYKSENNGVSWENIVISENTEDFVFDLIIREQHAEHIMAGLGMGILKSKDDGKNWTTVYNKANITTFTHSALNPEIVYASGRNSSGRLFFLASQDFGDTWETVEFEGGPTQIQVNDIISIIQNGHEVLYLGTNKGVYTYTFDK